MLKHLFYYVFTISFLIVFVCSCSKDPEVVFDLPEETDTELPDEIEENPDEGKDEGDKEESNEPVMKVSTYTNPLKMYKDNAEYNQCLIWDPSILRVDNKFYAYSTDEGWKDGTRPCIGVFSSDNLIDWTFEAPAIKDEDKPDGVWQRGIEVIKSGDKYVLYFFGNSDVRCYVSDSPETGFKACDGANGILTFPQGVTVVGDAMPGMYEEDGKLYMVNTFKYEKGGESKEGVGILEMKDYKTVDTSVEIVFIAPSGLSNVAIIQCEGTYYLIGKDGNYWDNNRVKAMKSTTLKGTYSGEDKIVCAGSAAMPSVNGFGSFIKDDAGSYWGAYSVKAGQDTRICIDKILFDAEGYPYVEGREPSTSVLNGPQFCWITEMPSAKE